MNDFVLRRRRIETSQSDVDVFTSRRFDVKSRKLNDELARDRLGLEDRRNRGGPRSIPRHFEAAEPVAQTDDWSWLRMKAR